MGDRTVDALRASTLILTITVPLSGDGHDNDWPQFRGHHRNGVSAETGLLDSWPEGGPTEVWRRPIGDGYAAISIVGDRIYTMYSVEREEGSVEVAAAFGAADGEEIWQTEIGEKLDTEFGNGPRSTPTIDNGVAYVLGSFGDLVALKTGDGSEVWRLSLTEAFGSSRPYWGFSTSPLVDGDRLIVEGGGPEGKSYAGLDKTTGEVLWTSGTGGREPGYNSPIAVDMNGKRRYVYVAGSQLRCIDENGEEVWAHEWPQGETHASPIFIPPNRIYASGAQGVGAALIEVQEGGDGASAEAVWKLPNLRNHFSSSIVHDGYIYGFDNATFKSVSVDTGELAWAKRGLGKGSLIFADGHLLILTDRGRLLQIEASPDGYLEKGSVQALEGKSWTAPTLSRGRVYLRNHTEMVSYDLNG